MHDNPRPATGAPVLAVTVPALVLAGVSVIGVAVLALLLWRLLHVVLLVLTAIILAEGVRGLVNLLNRRGVPFALSMAAAYLAIVVAVLGLFTLLAGPTVRELVSLTSYQSAITANVDRLLNAFQVSSQQLTSLAGSLLGAAGGVVGSILSIGGGLVALVGDLLTVFLLSITWMAVTRDLKGFVVGLFSVRRRPLVDDLIAEAGRAFAGYVRGVTINMLAIGCLALLACWVLRLPAPLLLGVFAGLCELIPLVGPFLGAVPAVLLGFTIGPLYPLVVAAAFLVLQQVESNVLTPVVMRHEVGLRPFVVILALLTGAGLAGIWGALVAVPVGSAIQIIVVRVVAPAIRARQATQVEQLPADPAPRDRLPPGGTASAD
ncbi:MAG TPA: AI-2E family transporter [Candidatus Dormibacteraeota bacterium]